MVEPIVIPGLESHELEAMPIKPEWIRQGTPVARGKLLANAPDKLAYIFIWECGPGVFEWHYAVEEETVYFVAGEAFISIDGGAEQRVAAGDTAVFPPGCVALWRITRPVRKVAILRKHLPLPLQLATRAWNKLLRAAASRSLRSAAARPAGGLLQS